jgi:Tfp pilus assembly protein PilZ
MISAAVKRLRKKPRTSSDAPPTGQSARRSPFRVPFVRKSLITFSDGASRRVFIANINEYGAFMADDDMPSVGQGMTLRFRLPGSETDVEATGAVAWLNPKQQHPVHSLPAGYGVQFDPLRDPLLAFVLGVVEEFLERHSIKH